MAYTEEDGAANPDAGSVAQPPVLAPLEMAPVGPASAETTKVEAAKVETVQVKTAQAPVAASPIAASPIVGQAAATRATALRDRVAPAVERLLAEQVAAWNAGDLERFMDVYWRSDDLRFVSNQETMQGWRRTLESYVERYGGADVGPGSLGRLELEDLDVKLITDDVAITVGSYKVSQNGAESNGVFSLVMRNIDGAWRIVHDHSSQRE